MDPTKELALRFQERSNEARYEFSDRILTLASTLLGLSVTFRTSVLGKDPAHLWLIKFSWICLALSSVAGVLWRYSKVDINLEIFQKLYAGETEVHVREKIWYSASFWVCLTAFAIGIICLTAFGLLNI